MPTDMIASLLVLQDRDLRCEGFRRHLQSIPFEVDKEKRAIAEEKRRLEEAESVLRQLEVRRGQLELEIESHQATVLRYKNQQLQVKKNEEYSALSKEIENLQSQIDLVESQVLQLMEESDLQSETLQKVRADVQEKTGLYEGHIRMLEAGAVASKEELKDAEEKVLAAEAKVEAATLDRYRYVKSQVKRGPYVVPLDAGKCGGCHLKVSGDVESAAMRGSELVRCESCGRILYYQR